jgi:hypothetical protein
MVKFPAYAVLVGMVLSACGSIVKETKSSQDWQPSTLKSETLSRVQEALRTYRRCIDNQTRIHLNDKEDSRKVADTILTQCESKLLAVKAPFDAEQVPDAISNRYLRSKRSLAAQQVVRAVMAVQAVRSASEQP